MVTLLSAGSSYTFLICVLSVMIVSEDKFLISYRFCTSVNASFAIYATLRGIVNVSSESHPAKAFSISVTLSGMMISVKDLQLEISSFHFHYPRRARYLKILPRLRCPRTRFRYRRVAPPAWRDSLEQYLRNIHI